ncbi:MAG TPA: hypothetical protein ENK70_00625, partial [Methylophaga sp.]|nr:hypothetical protein [Methylophaga sp.]
MSNSVFARFFNKSIQHAGLSKKKNRPVFNNVEYVEIIISGDKNNRPVLKVNDTHRRRFEKEYSAFKRGEDEVLQGTPISEWNGISRTRADELKSMGIKTIESLAELPDTYMKRLGFGGVELRKKALAYFNKDSEAVVEVQEAMAQLKLETKVELNKAKDKLKDAGNIEKVLRQQVHMLEQTI